MDKIVFIIPGFLDNPKDKIYQQIADCYKNKGCSPLVLDIPWKRQIMSDYVNYFLKVYSKYQNSEIRTLGFSFGAMISFIASSRVPIKNQILCSLSPYFQEEIPLLKKSWADGVGKKRMIDFSKLSRKEIVKKIKADTILLVGAKEQKIMIEVSKSVYKDLKTEKNLVIIEGVGHKISNKKYFEEIKNQINKL